MAELRRKSSSASLRKKSSQAAAAVLRPVKCCILGDGNVGKSAMLITFLTGKFPESSSSGPIDGLSEFSHLVNKPKVMVQENSEVHLTLVDTYGQDEYGRLRERVCASADVYILCCDVTRRATLDRIEVEWLPEIREYSAPGIPFVVAGLKTDIRSQAVAEGSDDMDNFVTFSKGKKQALAMGAAGYVECSALKNVNGVNHVFDTAARAAAAGQAGDPAGRGSCALQ